MPSFRGVSPTVVGVEVVAIVMLFLAAKNYEWSSEAAFAGILTAGPSLTPNSAQPQTGRTGCLAGKKELPTQPIPFR